MIYKASVHKIKNAHVEEIRGYFFNPSLGIRLIVRAPREKKKSANSLRGIAPNINKYLDLKLCGETRRLEKNPVIFTSRPEIK